MDQMRLNLNAASKFILDRLPADRNKQILLAGSTIGIASIILSPLAYYWTLGRQVIHTFPNASSRSASLDCGEISSFPSDIIENPKKYRIDHDKVTKLIPEFTVTLSPKHQRVFTSVLQHNMLIFATRSPQGRLFASQFNTSPEEKRSFTREYFDSCQFDEGDIICGVFEVSKRTPLRCEMKIRQKQGFSDCEGLLVISLRPRGMKGAVLTSETIQWTEKSNGWKLPMEKSFPRFLHDFLARYLAISGANYLLERVEKDDV